MQAEMVKQQILEIFQDLDVIIIPKSSSGDVNHNVPLSALEGSDFFTEEIFNALKTGEADIAVHSLKDMSATHFFSHDAFAVVDRDDVRDLAIFNADVLDKIAAGLPLRIGTCSPRREKMAMGFLKKALPQLGKEIQLEIKAIRGNVEGRLHQLDTGNYDGTILATAGLNRLLKSENGLSDTDGEKIGIHKLLATKQLMLLPIIECVPAPCQGAIVAEADPKNIDARAILNAINKPALFEEVYAEKKLAFQYGTGCLQKFGVTTIRNKHIHSLYAAGEDKDGVKFDEWSTLPNFKFDEKTFFSTITYMKDFFQYEYAQEISPVNRPCVFVANYKPLQHPAMQQMLSNKLVWASGTKTWFELSKLGYWVQGSADSLGFEELLSVISMPIFNTKVSDITILTHEEAAERWKANGIDAVSLYRLLPKNDDNVIEQMKKAKTIFWTSYAQFKYYGKYIKKDAMHITPSGETASLLKQQGITPIIFPTIKAFNIWQKKNT